VNKGMLRRLVKIAANDYDSTSYPKETERLLLAGLIVRTEKTAPYTGGYRPPYAPAPKVTGLAITDAGRAALAEWEALLPSDTKGGG